jgi:hypothetical protein
MSWAGGRLGPARVGILAGGKECDGTPEVGPPDPFGIMDGYGLSLGSEQKPLELSSTAQRTQKGISLASHGGPGGAQRIQTPVNFTLAS